MKIIWGTNNFLVSTIIILVVGVLIWVYLQRFQNGKMTLKKSYPKPSSSNVKKLIDYLSTIAGKSISLSSIRQNIFKTKWSSKDILLRNRCQVQAAIHYLQHILRTQNVDESKEDIRTLIADIAPYVRGLDKKEERPLFFGQAPLGGDPREAWHPAWPTHYPQRPRCPDDREGDGTQPS